MTGLPDGTKCVSVGPPLLTSGPKSPRSTPRFLCHAATGFPQSGDWKIYQQSLAAYPNLFDFLLGSCRLLQNLTIGKSAAAHREELCSNHSWYRSEVYNEFRRLVRADGNVISIVKHQPGMCTVMDVNQNSGDAPPKARAKRQLMFLHELIDPLVGTVLATERQRSVYGLTPKQRETLDLLLLGDSEKQIAAKMGVSRPTVHEHIGKIYRHFKIRSRPELMAYFIQRIPIPCES